MLRKIDLRRMIKDHTRTLRDNQTGSAWPDRLIFGGMPIIVASASAVGDLRLRDTGSLLAAVSVFGGLLFALLVMLLQMAGTAAERMESTGPTERSYRRVAFLREIAANVAYAVFVSVVCTVVLGMGQLTLPAAAPSTPGKPMLPEQPAWFTLVALIVLLHLVLTLLMVLKRTYTLLIRELDYASVPASRG